MRGTAPRGRYADWTQQTVLNKKKPSRYNFGNVCDDCCFMTIDTRYSQSCPLDLDQLPRNWRRTFHASARYGQSGLLELEHFRNTETVICFSWLVLLMSANVEASCDYDPNNPRLLHTLNFNRFRFWKYTRVRGTFEVRCITSTWKWYHYMSVIYAIPGKWVGRLINRAAPPPLLPCSHPSS